MVLALPEFTLDPEQFAGAFYKSPHGPTCLTFASGKIVIIGAKSEEQVITTENSLSHLLNQFVAYNNELHSIS